MSRPRLLLTVLLAAAWPATLFAQLAGPIPPMRLTAGSLSFDGHATPGDFTGSTKAVTGEMTGGESLSAVRGWARYAADAGRHRSAGGHRSARG